MIDYSLVVYKKELRRIKNLKKSLAGNKKHSKKNKKSIKKKLIKRKNKYQLYLLSDEWVNIKIDLFDKRGRMCEKCFSTNNLHVHHLTYKNIFKEEPIDLMILCSECHKKEHNIK